MDNSKPTGFAQLVDPVDLFQKLKHDHSRMKQNPLDSYAAFDFFVTAEHLLDWQFPDTPGKSERSQRKKVRESEPILALVSHIASGAKHFQATAKQHKSVKRTEHSNRGGFDPRAFSTAAFSPKSFSFPGIVVHLEDGSVRHVFDIADEVMAYWETQITD